MNVRGWAPLSHCGCPRSQSCKALSSVRLPINLHGTVVRIGAENRMTAEPHSSAIAIIPLPVWRTPRETRTSQRKHMGKGDKKSARGKIWRGSYGNTRPHRAAHAKPAAATARDTRKSRKK
ncbi:MAG TPA: 30S ribosomal protein THX [Gammaproteobacteria bacterium]|nr:30S ribosomal protein THX [Gammaproteobacteria bacterium]